MNRLNTILLIILVFLSLLVATGVKSVVKIESVSQDRFADQIEAKKIDQKAEILSAYLAKHNSPLQYHAQDFIDAANEFGLDWRLVASIAGVESTFGKFIPGGYNGWGWGVYGKNAIYFKSWKDGIFTVSRGLKENYIDKGLTEPYEMNRVYAASPVWGRKVSFFMTDLEKFANDYEALEQDKLTVYSPDKTAVSSALLAFK